MEIKNWLVVSLLVVIVPMWIGSIWCYFAKMTGKLKNLLFAWVSGFLTVMAVSKIILVPMVLRRVGFTEYRYTATALYLALMIWAVYLNRKNIVRIMKNDRPTKVAEASEKDWNHWQLLFLVGALGLILLQAGVAGLLQHIDDDDSRFVVEQVLAVEHNTMFKENPVTGALSYWDMGEVRKDMISPWPMLVAYWCKLSGIAPAIMSHKFLPLFLTLLCYAVYALLGMHLFKDDREKVSIFLIFASALNIYGYFSTHTTSAVMLLRIWQGKALVGALLVPAMFYIMFEIMNRNGEKTWYFLGATTATAAALASGSGITIIPVVIGICGLAEIVHTKKIVRGIMIWCTAIPSVIYLLCYLFFWQLLKVYF